MNSKEAIRKMVKRTPLQTTFVQYNQILQPRSSTSRPNCDTNSLYAAISNKPVSVEEHNKILIKNQRLAKENSLLKTYLNKYKQSFQTASNETIELKQKLSSATNQINKLKSELKKKKTPHNPLFSDQLKTAVNLLMEDYLAIDSIKSQINEFGGRVESVKGIMGSLKSLIDSDNQIINQSINESESSELSADPFWSSSSGSSLRLSLSSQEIDVKRRLSTERIRRDFQILSELSTIMENSTEQSGSSLGRITDNNSANAIHENPNTIQRNGINGSMAITMASDKDEYCNGSTTGINSIANNNAVKTTDNSKSTKTKAKKEVKPKNKTKAEKNPKKKVEKQTKSKPKAKANDSIVPKCADCPIDDISIFDFNENDENKENVVPLIPPQRHSKRIRSKRFSLSLK